MYWDQEIETLARPELEKLQLERLQKTVGRVAGRVAFYKQKFSELKIQPGSIRSLEDLRRLPFTVNADLRAAYPAGMLAVKITAGHL